jgi:hypothetical protein
MASKLSALSSNYLPEQKRGSKLSLAGSQLSVINSIDAINLDENRDGSDIKRDARYSSKSEMEISLGPAHKLSLSSSIQGLVPNRSSTDSFPRTMSINSQWMLNQKYTQNKKLKPKDKFRRLGLLVARASTFMTTNSGKQVTSMSSTRGDGQQSEFKATWRNMTGLVAMTNELKRILKKSNRTDYEVVRPLFIKCMR